MVIQSGLHLIGHVGDLLVFAQGVGLRSKVNDILVKAGKREALTRMSVHDSLDQRSKTHFESLRAVQRRLYRAKALHGLFRSRFDAHRVELPFSWRRIAFARNQHRRQSSFVYSSCEFS